MYKGSQQPILHECINGHRVYKRPNDLFSGYGCPDCTNHGFDNNSPAVVYYIKINKDNETYYKIGVTNSSVIKRFSADRDKIIKIIKEWPFEKGSEAKYFEQQTLKEFTSQRVHIPNWLKSNGNTELFELDVLNLDMEHNNGNI